MSVMKPNYLVAVKLELSGLIQSEAYCCVCLFSIHDSHSSR
jgi:hypothetical protein